MSQYSTEMTQLHHRQDAATSAGPSSAAAAAAGEGNDTINSYLRTDDGMMWLASQLATKCQKGVQDFQDLGSSLKMQFEKDVLSKMPAGFPWDSYFASLRQSGHSGDSSAGATQGLPPMPSLPSLPNLSSLPPYLVNKYFNTRMRAVVEENARRFLKVAALAVPAACVVFEATKQAAIYSVRKAAGPLGPLSRWLLHAALPTGFYGPAIGCFVSFRYLRHAAAKREQRRKEAEERAKITLLQQQAAGPGDFGAYLKNQMKQRPLTPPRVAQNPPKYPVIAQNPPKYPVIAA